MNFLMFVHFHRKVFTYVKRCQKSELSEYDFLRMPDLFFFFFPFFGNHCLCLEVKFRDHELFSVEGLPSLWDLRRFLLYCAFIKILLFVNF